MRDPMQPKFNITYGNHSKAEVTTGLWQYIRYQKALQTSRKHQLWVMEQSTVCGYISIPFSSNNSANTDLDHLL